MERWRAPSRLPRSAAANSPQAPATIEDWKALLGRKVSVRYRLHDDPDHPFSEAIGMVQSVAPDDEGREVIEIMTRRGELRSVPLTDVLAAKVF